jgi:hypothetical protein
MVEKTEGKMEGLIRTIIKDKLDDGQLDHCDLTLKDLNTVANAFMRVFGGYFHEREEYPEMKLKRLRKENKGTETAYKKVDETNQDLSGTNETNEANEDNKTNQDLSGTNDKVDDGVKENRKNYEENQV